MNNRTLTILTLVVAVGALLLLAINFTEIFQGTDLAQYLVPQEVKSISITRGKQEYPIPFNNKTNLIAYINKSVSVKKVDLAEAGTSPNFDKIIFKRFNQPDVEITPVKYIGNDLVFSQTDWNPTGWFRDISEGKLKEIIQQATQVKEEAPAKTAVKAPEPVKNDFLALDNVAGITLVGFDKSEKKLSSTQYSAVVDYINQSTPIDKQVVFEYGKKTDIDKIVITRLNQPNANITVVAYLDDEIVFSEPVWSPNGLLKDNSHGAFKNQLTPAS